MDQVTWFYGEAVTPFSVTNKNLLVIEWAPVVMGFDLLRNQVLLDLTESVRFQSRARPRIYPQISSLRIRQPQVFLISLLYYFKS